MFLGLDFGTSAVKALLVDGDAAPRRQRHRAASRCSARRRDTASRIRRPGGRRCWTRSMRSGATMPRPCPPSRASACPARCTARCCWTTPAPCCVPPSCGTTSARPPNAPSWRRPFPALRQVTGNIAMPGFTAPKLLWVRRHEPEVFARVRKVLLPKAYIRYRLTGEMIEEMSDASGTLWLDVGARDWSDVALAATGLTRAAMPRLVEGNAAAGTLTPRTRGALAHDAPAGSGGRRWGQRRRCGRAVGDPSPATRSSRSARPACCLPPPDTSGRIRRPRCTPSAMRCPAPGTRWASPCRRLPRWRGGRGITGRDRGRHCWPRLRCRQRRAPRCSCPISAASGRRTTTARSAAPSSGCRTTPTARLLTQAVLEGVAFSLRDCLDALAASGHPHRGSGRDRRRLPLPRCGSPSSPRPWTSRCIGWPRASMARRSARLGWHEWRSPAKTRARSAPRPSASRPSCPIPSSRRHTSHGNVAIARSTKDEALKPEGEGRRVLATAPMPTVAQSSAGAERGPRCSRPAFIRTAGTVQTGLFGESANGRERRQIGEIGGEGVRRHSV